jgi:hypothetical protein
LDKLNFQPQYFSAHSYQTEDAVHEREISTSKLAVGSMATDLQDVNAPQPRASVSLGIAVDATNPLDTTSLSADRRVSAYQKIASLL